MSAAANVTLGFTDHLTRGMKAPITAMGQFRGSVLGVVRSLTSMKGLMMSFGAGFGVFNLANSFIEANASLEKMKIQLQAMTGKGDEAFKWIQDFQLKNPIADLETLTKTFNQLVSAGINPTTGALKAMVGAMAKFNLTADNLKSITRATRQMTALTNAQKQELNQLVEQIPMLTAMVAKEMGMSQEELLKQLEDRKIDSKELANAMFRGLMKETDGMVEQMANTWEAGMSRMKTAWFNLMTAMGETGLFDRIKKKLDEITMFITNNQANIITVANDIGSAFINVFNQINTVGKNIFGEGGFIKAGIISLDFFFTSFSNGLMVVSTSVKALMALFGNMEKRVFFAKERVASMFGTKGPSEKLKEEIEELKTKHGYAMRNQSILTNGDSPEVKAIAAEIKKKEAMFNQYKQWFKGEDEYEKITRDFIDGISNNEKEYKKRLEMWKKMTSGYNFTPVSATSGGSGPSDKGMEIAGTTDPFAESAQLNIAKLLTMWQSAKNELAVSSLDYARKAKMAIGDMMKSWEELAKAKPITFPNDFILGMTESIDEMNQKWIDMYGTLYRMGKEFATITANAMAGAFDEFFFDVLEGNLKKATDYFNSFFKSIARSIAQIASQQIAAGIIGGIVTSFGGTIATPETHRGYTTTPTTSGAYQPDFRLGTSNKPSAPIQVNISNEAGQPIRAKSATASQSNSGLALNLVLEGLSRNENGSRDALRAMMA